MSLLLLLKGTVAAPDPTATFPTVAAKIAFSTQPLDPPAYTDVSAYLREFQTRRGRSYEYDRMEAGTASYVLDNRDQRFNPDNTLSPYSPNVKPTRRVKLEATWAGVTYPLFAGFTEGYPQRFPSAGFDQLVSQQASDWFMPLTRLRFPPATVYPQQKTGERIRACLATAGIAVGDTSIDTGQSTVAASEDLVGQQIIEHILLIAEAENGRFYAARDGVLTFRERHGLLNDEITPRGVFGDGGGSERPYLADGVVLEQDESKLVNVVRITIADDTIVEAKDQASIDEHFERTLEKTWPLASAIEAQDAADYMLSRLKDANVRVPALSFAPTKDPAVLWPIALGMEIGQKWTFKLRPKGGGDTVSKDLIVDGVQHSVAPRRWTTTLQLVPADTKTYWRLGVTGQSEVGVSTVLAY